MVKGSGVVLKQVALDLNENMLRAWPNEARSAAVIVSQAQDGARHLK